MLKRTALLAALAALAAGCGDSEPLDVAGNYSINITNGDNGCNFENWTVGETAANIPVVITQDGNQVNAEVQGLVGGLLDLWLGARVFAGQIAGDNLELTLYGENAATQGNCTYTVNSTLEAEVSGDFISGQLLYEAKTVGNPDCAALEGCVTVQDFNGARPPSP